MCWTLVALTSIPMTRAAGQRAACFAACDVPHPAMRIVRASVYGFVRPEQMEIRAAPIPVLPAPAIGVEIVDRPRIRVAFVEVLDHRRHVLAGNHVWLPADEWVCCQGTCSCYFPLVLAAVSLSST